jgi:O-antigen/teichoic acid export membrane protein
MVMEETLTQKTLHGLKWSYVSTIINAIMQVGCTAIMARLLNPSDLDWWQW